MAAMNPLKRGFGSERGAELIEFALVFPLLLLLVLGMVDFGFLFQRYEVLTNAAREGARIAVLPGYTTADVQARVCNYIQGGGVAVTGTCPSPTNPVISAPADVTIALPSGATLSAKRVTITYTNSYLFIGPIASLFGANLSTVPITTVAIMRDEVAP
jgi:Flp pilus assembly protein TadG